MTSISKPQPWQPIYSLTLTMVNALLEIERARTAVMSLPLSPTVEAKLRFRARVRATHYSTYIEGNRLTLEEVEQVIRLTSSTAPVDVEAFLSDKPTNYASKTVKQNSGTENMATGFPGRERDVTEVRHYWEALLKVEDWAVTKKRLTEKLIQQLHAIVENGPRARPTPYRTEQNAIRETRSHAIIYMPPEACDVPGLMASLVAWVEEAGPNGLPAPLVAALAHYQFVTIHPYMDGNGRTGRLLATFLLHQAGYDLKGFYSLEEHYASNLAGYYSSLETHPHHNYYEGRAEADLTAYLEYFLGQMAKTFVAVHQATEVAAGKGLPTLPEELRRLEPRARRILGLFSQQDTITSQEVAEELGLSQRMARNLLNRWIAEDWLEVANVSRRARSYSLSALYRQYFEELTIANIADKGT